MKKRPLHGYSTLHKSFERAFKTQRKKSATFPVYTTFRAATTYRSKKEFVSIQSKKDHPCVNYQPCFSYLLSELGLTESTAYLLKKNSQYHVKSASHVGTLNEPVKKHEFFQKLNRSQVQFPDFSMRNVLPYSENKARHCTVVRPLLDFSRIMITTICISQKIPIYPDKSNQSLFCSRNRIRKQILPSLQLVCNPKVEEAIFRFAELAYQDYKLTSQVCRQNGLSL